MDGCQEEYPQVLNPLNLTIAVAMVESEEAKNTTFSFQLKTGNCAFQPTEGLIMLEGQEGCM